MKTKEKCETFQLEKALSLKKKNNKHSHRSQKISPNSPGQETKIGLRTEFPWIWDTLVNKINKDPVGLYSWGQRERKETNIMNKLIM